MLVFGKEWGTGRHVGERVEGRLDCPEVFLEKSHFHEVLEDLRPFRGVL